MKLCLLVMLLTVAQCASAAQPVSATASSSYTNRDPVHAINGSGLQGGAHDNQLTTAWHSGIGKPCWFRVDLGKSQHVRFMKLWNLNWAPYTDRGIKQADIYWSAEDAPGNPIDNPTKWTLAVEDQRFTRASHWEDYGRNRERRMPDVVDLGDLRTRYICLKIDANFTKSGGGYFGISEIAFSATPFLEPPPTERPERVPGPRRPLVHAPQVIAKDTRFPAPREGWDLSRYQFVEFDLVNESKQPVAVSCWVFALEGWGGSGTFPTDSGLTFLEPGESAQVRIDLHARFLGAAGAPFCKLIDPRKIARAEVVYSLKPGEKASPLQVRAITALGRADPAHDVSGRLLVPEISPGDPRPGKRVRVDRHVMYLPTDWKPSQKFPVILEYPGNRFFDKFCYSPGHTKYGRLGWGLSKDLGDPSVPGDGFIWLNLPFLNDLGNEQDSGWGNPQATIDYCLKTVQDVCQRFGGDPDAVVFTGFSRGALAANYLGLRTPEMAGLIRAWHRTPIQRAPADRGGWHGMYAGQNARIDHHYQGQAICPNATVRMGPSAHVDCGYLEDRPRALAGRQWLKEVLTPRLRPLRNEAYNIWPQADGSLHIANVGGGGYDVFRPEFTVIATKENPRISPLKWEHPVYNLSGWKGKSGNVEADVFGIGQNIIVREPSVTRTQNKIIWTFTHDRFDLVATVTLPGGRGEPRLDYQVRFQTEGHYLVAYSGAPAWELDNVSQLWQPLVWDGRRLPETSFLIGDDHCSLPGCLVEHRRGHRARTVGVMADPGQFPYEMPTSRNRKFGVTVRNQQGHAQALVFAPFPGRNSHFQDGETHRFSVRLVAQPGALTQAFEHVATHLCSFKDRRENTLTTLNQTLDNMVEYALSPWAAFDAKNKSSYYPDAKGTVKNVSALHPFSAALVTDNQRLFREQTVPIMEYLLSREKFLFATAAQGLRHSQRPSMRMNGPAMPVSELAALYRMSRNGSPVFLRAARRLYGEDRKLNMNWVTAGATWQRSLALYRATGDKPWLQDAITKANHYIARRVDTPPVDFGEAGDGTFFEYLVPRWKELYELYLETRDPKHLEAAHRGARRYAQFVWFYPTVPEGDITVNPRGLASRRGDASRDGLLQVPQETVPAWRVSDQGLLCEGNGTAQRLGILIATHAPYFLRIAHDTGDSFLRDIARSAVIGRYANFPGYHLNTRFGTAQEKPDFPLHAYDVLKPTTSMHYNHILPQINLVIDYLYSRAYDLSGGAIDFPTEFIEGYAYLQSKLYGARPGKFYDVAGVTPWLPKELLSVDNVQINTIAARGEDVLCLAFMNASDRPADFTFQLNPFLLANLNGQRDARVWVDNVLQETKLQVTNGRGRLQLRGKGITAVSIVGPIPQVRFQNQLAPSPPLPTIEGSDPLESMVLSFGPSLRWFYAYSKAEPGSLQAVSLTLQVDGETTQWTDNSYPFEFSVPISPAARTLRFQTSSH